MLHIKLFRKRIEAVKCRNSSAKGVKRNTLLKSQISPLAVGFGTPCPL
jgi:hypothetical protein